MWTLERGPLNGAIIGLLMAVREPGIDGRRRLFGTADFLTAFIEEISSSTSSTGRRLTFRRFRIWTSCHCKHGQLSVAEMRLELRGTQPPKTRESQPAVLGRPLADDVVPDAESRRPVEAIEAVGGGGC